MALSFAGNGTITGLSVGGLPDGCIDSDTLSAGTGGKVLQLYTLENTATHSTSVVFSNGTTLPTLSDGASLFDASAFTPTSSSSKILVEADVVTSGTNGGHATVWMCKDSTSNAVAVSSCHSQTSYMQLLKLTYLEDATNTDARTFKLRFANNYGGRTTTVNKNHEANHTWGGLKSWIKITEYAT